MTAAPKRVTINLRAIVQDAEMIADATDRLDELAEWLRDLADPRITLPNLPTLRERLREWAADLEQVSEAIWDAADGIGTDIREALDDGDDDDGGVP